MANENIVTGRYYRVLSDAAQQIWDRISFWSKASDTEANDGIDLETKVGAINGITDDLSCEDSSIAASSVAVNRLNESLQNVFNVELIGSGDYSQMTITKSITDYKIIIVMGYTSSWNTLVIPTDSIEFGTTDFSLYQDNNFIKFRFDSDKIYNSLDGNSTFSSMKIYGLK